MEWISYEFWVLLEEIEDGSAIVEGYLGIGVVRVMVGTWSRVCQGRGLECG